MQIIDNYIFSNIYYGCLVISALSGALLYRKLETPFKWIAILVGITLANETIAWLAARGPNHSNNLVYLIFTPIEYMLYVQIFTKAIRSSKWTRILWMSALLLILFVFMNTLILQSKGEDNNYPMILESTLLVILSLLMFLKIRTSPSQQNLLREGIFWFNSAVLCYYAFNVIMWGFHNMKVYLFNDPPTILYTFNTMLSACLYLIYIIALYLNSRRTTATSL